MTAIVSFRVANVLLLYRCEVSWQPETIGWPTVRIHRPSDFTYMNVRDDGDDDDDDDDNNNNNNNNKNNKNNKVQ